MEISALASSLTIVPVTESEPICTSAAEEVSTTLKVSLVSSRWSPATWTVMVFIVSPAANATVPNGNTPPTKSAPLAAAAPVPATCQVADAVRLRSPERKTVNVIGVAPL